MEARERGAKVIHVDPRFTRTSAMADIWLPLRAGSDIIFLGALIRYAIETNKYFLDYVVHYTNAPVIPPPRIGASRSKSRKTHGSTGRCKSKPTLPQARSVEEK